MRWTSNGPCVLYIVFNNLYVCLLRVVQFILCASQTKILFYVFLFFLFSIKYQNWWQNFERVTLSCNLGPILYLSNIPLEKDWCLAKNYTLYYCTILNFHDFLCNYVKLWINPSDYHNPFEDNFVIFGSTSWKVLAWDGTQNLGLNTFSYESSG